MLNIFEDSLLLSYGRWCHLMLCGYYALLESLTLLEVLTWTTC